VFCNGVILKWKKRGKVFEHLSRALVFVYPFQNRFTFSGTTTRPCCTRKARMERQYHALFALYAPEIVLILFLGMNDGSWSYPDIFIFTTRMGPTQMGNLCGLRT
jgi:hypothetical protein